VFDVSPRIYYFLKLRYNAGTTDIEAMLDDLRSAKKFIFLEFYIIDPGLMWNRILEILVDKVQQGVEVKLLYDDIGCMATLSGDYTKRLRKMGIDAHKFNKVIPRLTVAYNNRDHRKIVIIDGKIAYTGGMNVADYYIKGTEIVGSWHDMHCRIEGDEVNTLQKIFLRMWFLVSGQKIYGAKYYRGITNADYINDLKKDTCRSAGNKMVGIINREPHVTKDIIRYFYINAINDAKDSIKLINPYFTLSHSLKKAFRNAIKRGVKVEILLSVKSDIPLTPDCGFFNAHQLMKAGCQIWLYKPGFHHTKVIMVDGKFCTVGSANLNARSLRFDYEENAIIVDKETTLQLSNLFDKDKADSDFEYWWRGYYKK